MPIAIIEERQTELAELCRRCHVRRLDLFGSAATGKFNPATSDLDFLVEFEPLPPLEYGAAWFALLDGLTNLFGRDIDLLTAKSVVNPYLAESIEESRQNVYSA